MVVPSDQSSGKFWTFGYLFLRDTDAELCDWSDDTERHELDSLFFHN